MILIINIILFHLINLAAFVPRGNHSSFSFEITILQIFKIGDLNNSLVQHFSVGIYFFEMRILEVYHTVQTFSAFNMVIFKV